MHNKAILATLAAASLMTLGLSAHAQYAPHRDRDHDGISNARDPQPNIPNQRVVVVPAKKHVIVSRYGPNGDLDRDGIANRADRDRDGDGVQNFRDRRPDDRRRS